MFKFVSTIFISVNNKYVCHVICSFLGTPNESLWPGVTNLPNFNVTFPYWAPMPFEDIFIELDENGIDLLDVTCKKWQ
jgi:hypothetical protein